MSWKKHFETIKVQEYFVHMNGRGEPFLELYESPTWIILWDNIITWKLLFYIPGYYKLWIKLVCNHEHEKKVLAVIPLDKKTAMLIEPDGLWEEYEEEDDGQG